ncbi:MAG: hypothetical protein WAM66_07600 [Acidobacteriaceae bacterium]
MAIQYSGNAQTSTFTTATKQDIINAVGAALLTAGWTTVSGGTGTTAWKLQSTTTPQGYAIRVLMQDNGGTCVTFSIESSDGTLSGGNSTTAGGGFLNPGGYTYRIVCSKYQAIIWATPDPIASRTFVAFGVPSVASWLVSSISRVGWMQGNAITDTDTGTRPSFRTGLGINEANIIYGAQQALLNSTLWSLNSTGTGNYMGQIYLAALGAIVANRIVQAAAYLNGAAIILDALIFWGATSASAIAACYGQLWDSFIIAAALAGDQTAAAPDGHAYIVVTDNSNGIIAGMFGTLMVATS